MSNGVASGLLLADLVLGRENPYAELYDAKRLKPVDLRARVHEGERERREALVRRPRRRRARSRVVSDLAPGEGRVARLNGELVAVHRDEAGLHAVSAVCTHLACLVSWNPAERSWDCPCHGSRFAADGTVVQGPAVKDLAPRDDVIRGLG